ncbi:GtrA family protein [bacterium]|nr:GtrA family protein [bacterium]
MIRKLIKTIISKTPLLKKLLPVYLKYEEELLYLLFGGLSFLLNILKCMLLTQIKDILIANIISWLITVAFSFITNKYIVFEKTTNKSIIKQLATFYAGRLLTLAIEEIILFIFVTTLHINDIIIKIIAQIIVIITNYIISKKLIFRKDESVNENIHNR